MARKAPERLTLLAVALAAFAVFSVTPVPALLAQQEPTTAEGWREIWRDNDRPQDERNRAAEIACDRFNDGPSCLRRGTVAAIFREDHALQYRYYSAACRNDMAGGCYRKGELQYKGLGTEKDLNWALIAFDNACRMGEPMGCKWKERILPEVRASLASRPAATPPSFRPAPAKPATPPALDMEDYGAIIARLEQVTTLTAVGSITCDEIRRRTGEGGAWSRTEEARLWNAADRVDYRAGKTACNRVPRAFAAQIEKENLAARPQANPLPQSTYSSCDSTCQREKTIRDNTPRRCWVSNGRRICNK